MGGPCDARVSSRDGARKKRLSSDGRAGRGKRGSRANPGRKGASRRKTATGTLRSEDFVFCFGQTGRSVPVACDDLRRFSAAGGWVLGFAERVSERNRPPPLPLPTRGREALGVLSYGPGRGRTIGMRGWSRLHGLLGGGGTSSGARRRDQQGQAAPARAGPRCRSSIGPMQSGNTLARSCFPRLARHVRLDRPDAQGRVQLFRRGGRRVARGHRAFTGPPAVPPGACRCARPAPAGAWT